MKRRIRLFRKGLLRKFLVNKSSDMRKKRVVNIRPNDGSIVAEKERPFSKTGHIADLHVSKSNDKIM
jgi:hypothetical protein